MDLASLRALSPYTQARAAELAGVSVRTWRRWECDGCLLAWRWLRLELGYPRGWPRGWQVTADGVRLEDGRLIHFAMIEAAPWILGMVEDQAARARLMRQVPDVQ